MGEQSRRNAVTERAVPARCHSEPVECGITILDNSRNDKKERNEMPKGERKRYGKAFKLSAVYMPPLEHA